jgi:hypothetical protein
MASLPIVVMMLREKSANEASLPHPNRFVGNFVEGLEAYASISAERAGAFVPFPVKNTRVPLPTCPLGHHVLFLRQPDKLPLRDVALFLSQASMLVAVEGASFANQVFLPLESTLLALSVQRGNPEFEVHGWPWHSSIAQYGRHRYLTFALEGTTVDWSSLIERIQVLSADG